MKFKFFVRIDKVCRLVEVRSCAAVAGRIAVGRTPPRHAKAFTPICGAVSPLAVFACRRHSLHPLTCRWRLAASLPRGYRSLLGPARSSDSSRATAAAPSPCVQLISSRRSRQAFTTGAPSTANSMPIITPSTRTSRITSHSRLQRIEPRAKQLRPIARACSSRFSCSIISMAAMPARAAIGLPPNVAACIPGRRLGAISAVVKSAPAAIPPQIALAKRHDVGRHAEMPIGEPLPRAAAAGLHFVENQEQSVVGGQLAEAGQKAFGRNLHAPFPLHRLDHDRGGFLVDQASDRFEIAEWSILKAGQQAGRFPRDTWAAPWRTWPPASGRESRRGR